MESIKTKNSTSVFSWLGLGMGTVLFLLVWFVNILVISWIGKTSLPSALFLLILMVGVPLGVLSIVFSIKGLVMAVNNNTPKWMGITGIMFFTLSLFSFFFPFMYEAIIEEETVQLETIEPVANPSESVTDTNDEVSYDVTIQIFSSRRVRCINNVDPNNSVIGNMKTYEHDFKKQLAKWLKMNNVDSSTSIIINSTNDADYSDITQVIDVLQDYGITKYKLSSTLSSSEYYD